MAKTSQAEWRHCNWFRKWKNAAITCRHGICRNQHCQSRGKCRNQQDKGWSQWKTVWNKWIWTHKMTFPFELWNMQFRFTGYIPRISSVFRDCGKSLALCSDNKCDICVILCTLRHSNEGPAHVGIMFPWYKCNKSLTLESVTPNFLALALSRSIMLTG